MVKTHPSPTLPHVLVPPSRVSSVTQVPCVALFLALFILSVNACAEGETADNTEAESPTTSNSGQSLDVRVDQAQSGCPQQSSKLTGTGIAGASCETAKDCAPICCNCKTGQSRLAAACIAKRCAPAQACAESLKLKNAGGFCQGSTATATDPSTGTPIDIEWPEVDDFFSDGDDASCSVSVAASSPYAGGSEECASCLSDKCCSSVKACDDDPACSAYVACEAQCKQDNPDAFVPVCGCNTQHPEGKALYDDVSSCSSRCGLRCG